MVIGQHWKRCPARACPVRVSLDVNVFSPRSLCTFPGHCTIPSPSQASAQLTLTVALDPFFTSRLTDRLWLAQVKCSFVSASPVCAIGPVSMPCCRLLTGLLLDNMRLVRGTCATLPLALPVTAPKIWLHQTLTTSKNCSQDWLHDSVSLSLFLSLDVECPDALCNA